MALAVPIDQQMEIRALAREGLVLLGEVIGR
jgi:hypothetical protein